MKIAAILQRHARSATLLDSEPVKWGLLDDLKAQKKFNTILYSIVFGGVCAVTAVAIAGVATDVFKGQNIRTEILAGAGLGVPVGIEWMRRIVREWSQLNLLITIVGYSDESAIQDLIKKLLSRSAIGLGPDPNKGRSASASN